MIDSKQLDPRYILGAMYVGSHFVTPVSDANVKRRESDIADMESGHHNTRQISILIADDHSIFAEALRLLLEKQYLVIGAVADGRALVDEGIRLRPDVVVTDLSMPLLNGLDAARRIKEAVPKVRFAFLTMHDDPHLAAAALELGHVAFVLKRSGGSELLGAIEHILRGKSYLSPKLKPIDCVAAKAMVSRFSKNLTKRQRDVVQLFAEGRPTKEIASILNLSEKTIQFHKYHIMQAFNIKNNAELVLFALERGLISVNAELQEGMRTVCGRMDR
jgi:DNA-binding NarL/FixJ family response regulator